MDIGFDGSEILTRDLLPTQPREPSRQYRPDQDYGQERDLQDEMDGELDVV